VVDKNVIKDVDSFLKPSRLEPDRFSLKQEESRFFEKKRRKKLLFGWACDGETSTAQSQKVFLLLFVHKKKSFFLADVSYSGLFYQVVYR
jgi:hypothetical protein